MVFNITPLALIVRLSFSLPIIFQNEKTAGLSPRASFLLVFFTDIIKDIQVPVQLFADDCVIYSVVKTAQDQVILNNDLVKIKR